MGKSTIKIILLTLIFNSCNQSRQSNSLNDNLIEKDILALVYTEDTLRSISKKEYETILKEKLTEIPKHNNLNPDSLYNQKPEKSPDFNSEQGKDFYYLIYAHYLSSNDNKAIPHQEVEEIEELYYTINLFMHTSIDLGSGFYHIIQRIPAYAQYDLLISTADNNKPDEKTKANFLMLLQKLVTEEDKRTLEITIEDIENQINTEFKLKLANSFLKNKYGHLLNYHTENEI